LNEGENHDILTNAFYPNGKGKLTWVPPETCHISEPKGHPNHSKLNKGEQSNEQEFSSAGDRDSDPSRSSGLRYW
jgi:hypothetical protein